MVDLPQMKMGVSNSTADHQRYISGNQCDPRPSWIFLLLRGVPDKIYGASAAAHMGPALSSSECLC